MNNENSDEYVICPCSGTTRGKVISLFQQGLDADAVSRKTGAISGCGGCEWDIAQIQAEFNANKLIGGKSI